MALAGFPLANRRPAALLPLGILAGAALVGAADALAAGWLVLAALVTFLGVVLLARHFVAAAPYALIGAALLQRLPVSVGGWHLYPEYAALGVVAVIATGRRLVSRPTPPVALPPLALFGFAVWLGVSGLAVAHALVPAESFKLWLQIGIVLAGWLAVTLLVRDGQDVRRWLRAFLTLGGVEAAFGLLTLGLHTLGFTGGIAAFAVQRDPVTHFYETVGTMHEGNLYGSAMGALCVVALVLLRRPPGGFSRRWLAVAAALTGLAGILSLSRSAWLAVLVGLILGGRALVRPSARTVVLIVIGLWFAAVGALALGATPSAALFARLGSFGHLAADSGVSSRFSTYRFALALVPRHLWVGWAPGTIGTLRQTSSHTAEWVGNVELRLLFDSGILGLAGWTIAVTSLLVGAFRAGLRSADSIVWALLLGVLVLLAAYQATDGTSFLLFWALLGVLTAATRITDAPTATRGRPSRSPQSSPPPAPGTARQRPPRSWYRRW